MRFQVTYTRTSTLAQIIDAGSEEEANALASDEIKYLLDSAFEDAKTTYSIEPRTMEESTS